MLPVTTEETFLTELYWDFCCFSVECDCLCFVSTNFAPYQSSVAT